MLGIGWAIGQQQDENQTWDDYYTEAEKEYGYEQLARVRYFYKNVHEGDLIWTRDPKGQYYLAKVLSSWQHLETVESLAADIVNFVKCEILQVKSADEVPGKVTACFRPARAIQRINDPTIELYSRQLWNELSNRKDYNISESGLGNIFAFLDAEETVLESEKGPSKNIFGGQPFPPRGRTLTQWETILKIHQESLRFGGGSLLV